MAGASSIPPSQLSPSPPPQHSLELLVSIQLCWAGSRCSLELCVPVPVHSTGLRVPVLCDTRHGRGHGGLSSKVLGMSLPPL